MATRFSKVSYLWTCVTKENSLSFKGEIKMNEEDVKKIAKILKDSKGDNSWMIIE